MKREINSLGYKLLAQAVLYEAAKAIARLRDGKKGPHNFHEPRSCKKALQEELAFLRYGVQHKGTLPKLKDPLCFHEVAGVGDLLETLSEKDLLQRISMRTRIFREDKGGRTNKSYWSKHEGKKAGKRNTTRRRSE